MFNKQINTHTRMWRVVPSCDAVTASVKHTERLPCAKRSSNHSSEWVYKLWPALNTCRSCINTHKLIYQSLVKITVNWERALWTDTRRRPAPRSSYTRHASILYYITSLLNPVLYIMNIFVALWQTAFAPHFGYKHHKMHAFKYYYKYFSLVKPYQTVSVTWPVSLRMQPKKGAVYVGSRSASQHTSLY